MALMSAERLGDELCPSDPAKKTYLFKQSVPIPSYLIAIVVGLLESRLVFKNKFEKAWAGSITFERP